MEERTLPTGQQLKEELKWEQHKGDYGRALRSTVYFLVVVAAAAVLAATLLFPVLRVTGTSMEPSLENKQIVLALKNSDFKRGDIVAFYYNNKILLKRVIAFPGEQVDIRSDGTVYVGGEPLQEPYLVEKSLGECDLEFPYQVPDGKIFVMGDHRATSVDSRSSAIGCISDEFIVGKVVLRVWPLQKIGPLA
ncbi:signal peptidase I [Clostridiaceae bacterium NSJ-31]|uniref:Signal peptidase I n=1 Tax=Ligaoa zhengdingensis TaxID=2763658 RepID=A0A926I3Z2_9FIRM|nr:signal peptidase I [Ligaoa zhengdingensis]MBC8546844.1 signal peptidase I [Ligaoa zhengdingensis]